MFVVLLSACVCEGERTAWTWIHQSSDRCCSSQVAVGMALYGSMMTLAQRMIMATSRMQRKAMHARVRPLSRSTNSGSGVVELKLS